MLGRVKQLSLFGEDPPREERAPDLPVPEPGTQLDLFADRLLLLVEARTTLSHLDPRAARRALRDALSRYPEDERLAEEIAALDDLAWRVDKALHANAGERPASLVAVAERIEPLRPHLTSGPGEASFPHRDLWRALLVRAATEAIRGAGDASLIGGRHEPGLLLLLAGEMESAGASLVRAFESTGRARHMALLAEHARRAGDRALAMHRCFSALREDPYDVDLGLAGDEDVRALPDLARDQFAIHEEPLAWSAAVGVVTGLFHLPMLDGAPPEPAPREDRALSPRRALALSRAREFLGALAASRRRGSTADVLTARRTMKRLEPALFDAVMGRSPER